MQCHTCNSGHLLERTSYREIIIGGHIINHEIQYYSCDRCPAMIIDGVLYATKGSAPAVKVDEDPKTCDLCAEGSVFERTHTEELYLCGGWVPVMSLFYNCNYCNSDYCDARQITFNNEQRRRAIQDEQIQDEQIPKYSSHCHDVMTIIPQGPRSDS